MRYLRATGKEAAAFEKRKDRTMKNELLKFASCKKENRRVELSVWKRNDGIAVVIYTKRLVDKKARHILESTVSYGLESFGVLSDVIRLIWDDPEFMKAINPELGQVQKTKWNISTNIKH